MNDVVQKMPKPLVAQGVDALTDLLLGGVASAETVSDLCHGWILAELIKEFGAEIALTAWHASEENKPHYDRYYEKCSEYYRKVLQAAAASWR
jgi:hypothetical protein